MLALASPALAASLGVSPSHTEIDVPGDGSATANFKVYYYSGDVEISLIDIPLKVEPQTFHVEASSQPEEIELTIYGDESLGSRIYDGYIRFIGKSEGGTIAIAVQVKAKVTNMVEGEAPVPASPEEPQLPEEEAPPEEKAVEGPAPPEETAPALTSPTEQAPPEQAPSPSGSQSSFPVLPVAGIAAGTAIIITLIIMVARSRYY